MVLKNQKSHGLFIDNSGQGYRREYLERLRRARKNWVILASFAWISILITWLYFIQVQDFHNLKRRGDRQHLKEIDRPSERGNIYDANGKLMASSLFSPSIFVHPHKIKESERDATVAKLANILSMDENEIKEKLNTKAPFVYIKRFASRDEAIKISELKDPAVGYERAFQRKYPYKSAISTVLGKVGTDEKGLSGLEAVFDKKLRGKGEKEIISKDALGKTIKTNEVDIYQVPTGQDIYLTIDADIQVIVDEQVKKARKNLHAKAVMATMIDAYTGDILAMSQSPGVNFNSKSIESQNDLKNLVIETVFEPGSIFKPIVAGIALDQGYVKETDMFDCELGRYRYGSATIKDSHPAGVLSFREVVIKSSNIGMTKIADRLGKKKLWTALSDYGIGKIVDLDFPGQTAGIFRHYSRWAKVDVATHSFGQGVAVTSLQILKAIASFVNGGYLPELRLLKSKPKSKKRVVSPETAETMKSVLVDVVQLGTGKMANVDGYVVGGKTGTAQKAKKNGRGYEEGKYIASFIGFVDTKDLGINIMPLLVVNVDEAHSTSIYGGALAGPVFKNIMRKTMRLLENRKLLN